MPRRDAVARSGAAASARRTLRGAKEARAASAARAEPADTRAAAARGSTRDTAACSRSRRQLLSTRAIALGRAKWRAKAGPTSRAQLLRGSAPWACARAPEQAGSSPGAAMEARLGARGFVAPPLRMRLLLKSAT
jgi:hypothetical protein